MKHYRIVVKVGSNVISRKDGHPDVTVMSGLVDQIAAIRKLGHQVVLVSSGAVACGRAAVKTSRKLDTVAQRQLYSAVGQVRLINIYQSLFEGYGCIVGQVLTQKDNFSSRQAYLNQRACMEVMLDNDVLPIVNENDTVSMTELMFTDNDELSGLIATMLHADLLIILSNIDGIYTALPTQPEARLIPEIRLSDNISPYISATKSGFGRGGMGTKSGVARKLAEEGIRVMIANGRRANILIDLITNPDSTPHTTFIPNKSKVSTIKRWIAHSSSFAKGNVIVNDNAAKLLKSDRAISLLPVGIVSADGDWEEGDIIGIFSTDGYKIAVGKASSDSVYTRRHIGQHDGRPVVHYDYLFLENPL